jgi:hypothetical protein
MFWISGTYLVKGDEYMRFGDVKVKQWFAKHGEVYMKVHPCGRGNTCFEAVSLKTGEFGFLAQPSYDDVEVDLVEKPDWIESGIAVTKTESEQTHKLERWCECYVNESSRALGKMEFLRLFPYIDVREENAALAFLLVADVSPAVHGIIKERFGGT